MNNFKKTILSLAVLSAGVYASSASAINENTFDGTYNVECSETPSPEAVFETNYDLYGAVVDTVPAPSVNGYGSFYEIDKIEFTDSAGNTVGIYDHEFKATCDPASGLLLLDTAYYSETELIDLDDDGNMEEVPAGPMAEITARCVDSIGDTVTMLDTELAWMSLEITNPNDTAMACREFSIGLIKFTNETLMSSAETPKIADNYYVDWARRFRWDFKALGTQQTNYVNGDTAGNQFLLNWNSSHVNGRSAHNYIDDTSGIIFTCSVHTYDAEKQKYYNNYEGTSGNTAFGRRTKGVEGACLIGDVTMDYRFQLVHEYKATSN